METSSLKRLKRPAINILLIILYIVSEKISISVPIHAIIRLSVNLMSDSENLCLTTVRLSVCRAVRSHRRASKVASNRSAMKRRKKSSAGSLRMWSDSRPPISSTQRSWPTEPVHTFRANPEKWLSKSLSKSHSEELVTRIMTGPVRASSTATDAPTTRCGSRSRAAAPLRSVPIPEHHFSRFADKRVKNKSFIQIESISGAILTILDSE